MLENRTINLWKQNLRCVPDNVWRQAAVEVLTCISHKH